MKVALAPMLVNAEEPEANARAMAAWVEELCKGADPIVFPTLTWLFNGDCQI